MTQLLRVFLVDDSVEYLLAVNRLLSCIAEIEVVGCANSGAQGVSMVEASLPHLVLMDLTMPGMDGLEATRRIKAQSNPPMVLIVSLNDSEMAIIAAREAGADGFIPKGDAQALQTRLAVLVKTLAAHIDDNGDSQSRQ